MMKRLLTILLLIKASLAFGQKSSFSVSGRVTDCQTKEPIKDVIVRLKGNDNSDIKVNTDSSGNYSFTNCFKTGKEYILSSDVPNDFGQSPAVKYGICPGVSIEKLGYLNDNKKKLGITDSINNQKQTYDFCLNRPIACGPAPTFYFKKNSTELLNAECVNYEAADTAVDCFVGFLMAHKSWAMELSSHSSSNEENKKELAIARGKMLSDLLVSKGIEPGRLQYHSYSDTRPSGYMTETGKWIENDSTNEKNRRVDINVLRKDFGQKEIIPTKTIRVEDQSEEK
ncbi:MAG: hypothetical protein H0X46_03400 [Bacteroidetes bacterium]|nr:hypothetical protein [Bacteroidota bacterium]